MTARSTSLALAICLFAGSAAHAATVTQTFGVQSAFTNGPSSLSFALTGLDPTVNSAINLDFSFAGDLNASNENFSLSIDGTNFGTGCDNNTRNGSFGFGNDRCSQNDNTVLSSSLLISAADAVTFLADGALDIVFSYSRRVNNTFVDITSPITSSGVTFNAVNNFNFAAGGTVTYQVPDIAAPIPLPGAMGLLVTALAGLGLMRRRRKA